MSSSHSGRKWVSACIAQRRLWPATDFDVVHIHPSSSLSPPHLLIPRRRAFPYRLSIHLSFSPNCACARKADSRAQKRLIASYDGSEEQAPKQERADIVESNMVTTRSGESTDDTATATPTKPTTRSSTTRTTTASPTPPASPTTRSRSTKSPAPTSSSRSTLRSPPGSSSSSSSSSWSHTPSNLALLWLAISLPLVIWDAGYVLLRPHSMPGGYLHSPIWKPYALYAEVDYVYGFPALASKNGWTATQTWFNVVETLGYAVYLYWVLGFGVRDGGEGRGAPGKREVKETVGGAGGLLEGLVERRVLDGKLAGKAVVLGFSVASLTFFKTVMYWVLEYFNGFQNIGHNDWGTLILMWIIPNGAWLIGPSYMMYVFGTELLEGLEIAAQGSSRKTK
ncbi:hypothetical protein BST61_g4235 [Cercospora zeina]